MKDLTPRREDLDPIEIASIDEIRATMGVADRPLERLFSESRGS